jgi:DnaJ-domain-containing protein 1
VWGGSYGSDLPSTHTHLPLNLSPHRYTTAHVLCTQSAALDLFGVPRGATDREIRKAFKKLAMQHHPDKNLNDPG